MKSNKRYCASVSMGKDSLAMLYMIVEGGYPLDEVVFYNTGVEFEAITDTRDKLLPQLNEWGIKFTELRPDPSFMYMMLEKPVTKRGTDIVHKQGYSWCGGPCRWGTGLKLKALKSYIGDNYDYVGIAADEQHRFHKESRPNRILFLAEMGITEAQALQYCYSKGYFWKEDGIPLYEILDRVSCWCCGNKNLKELFHIYCYLPHYWEKLKELQTKTTRPFCRKTGKTIFDLEIRFVKKLNSIAV